MRKTIIALLLLGGATACNGQNEKNKQTELNPAESKPQSSWKVNKKYDDKGNLIAYDSTYVWSYSSKDGKTQNANADSVLAEFRNKFSMDFPSFFSNDFDRLKMDDSAFYNNFSAPDYFMKSWQQHQAQMGMMMRQMDSLRNGFLRNNYPNINTRPTNKDLKTQTL